MASKTSSYFSVDWKNQKAIITGGNGFLGRGIVKSLVARNCGSIAIYCRNPAPDLEKIGVEVINGDIRDPISLKSAFISRTVVFHSAAKAGIWGKKDEFFGINVQGTENVLSACREKKLSALVFTGSPSAAYPCGKNIEGIAENSPYPDSYLGFYSESKAEAEKKILHQNFTPAVSIRPHLIWGPGDPHILPRVVERARNGRLLQIGDGANKVDLTYVENAAEAHLLAAENLLGTGSAAGKSYFISDGHPVLLWEWINSFLKSLGIPEVRKSISYRTAYSMGFILEKTYGLFSMEGEPPMTRFVASQLAHSHYFDISAARSDLGYCPLSNREELFGITVESFKRSLG